MDTQLANIADDFVKKLFSIQEVIEYSEAIEKYNQDTKLKSKIERYNKLVEEIQANQKMGKDSTELVKELNSISTELQFDPLYKEIIERQIKLKTFLQKCNDEISSAIGMDFARLATSAG